MLTDSAFFVGANIPWNEFGYDLGTGAFDRAFFDKAFGDLRAHGANAARFWVHADGRRSPSFASDGRVSGMGGDSFADDLSSLTLLARTHGVVLQLCLWSFDMCKQDSAHVGLHADLITNDTKAASYVDRALKPMLSVIGDDPNVVIEVVNEPEWCMAGSCNTKQCVGVQQMQRFTARIAAAVHAASNLTVTTGSASLKWSTTRLGGGQAFYWRDTALMGAFPEGGTRASLDFYNIHYYDWMWNPTWGYDPCREPIAYWGLDKPTVVAELPATSSHYTAAAMLGCAHANGFAGDLFWAYKPSPQFPIAPAYAALRNFTTAHAALTAHSTLLAWLQARRREHGSAAQSPIAPPGPGEPVSSMVPSSAAQYPRTYPRQRDVHGDTEAVVAEAAGGAAGAGALAEPLTKRASRNAFVATLESPTARPLATSD